MRQIRKKYIQRCERKISMLTNWYGVSALKVAVFSKLSTNTRNKLVTTNAFMLQWLKWFWFRPRGIRTSRVGTQIISMAWCKIDVTPLLTHWSYVSLTLTYRHVANDIHQTSYYGQSNMEHMRQIRKNIYNDVKERYSCWLIGTECLHLRWPCCPS